MVFLFLKVLPRKDKVQDLIGIFLKVKSTKEVITSVQYYDINIVRLILDCLKLILQSFAEYQFQSYSIKKPLAKHTLLKGFSFYFDSTL